MRPGFLICLILVASACKNPGSGNGSRDERDTREPSVMKPSAREDLHRSKALPSLSVREGAHRDLGRIREGIRTVVAFTLVNTGGAEASNITLDDLSGGGCSTVSTISSLGAGDSARLEFIFETLGYGGRKETREIEIRYPNPHLSPLKISVTAEVLPVEPHQVPIGELHYNFFVLLDVRDREAFRRGHIAGAIHVPEERLMSWVSGLPRDFLIYLCSEDGVLSDRLALQMQEQGYSQALSMVGGIREWKSMYGERVIIQGDR